MKQIIYIICFLAITTGLMAQTSTQNYILTRTYTANNGSTSMDQIQYFDGLGRPIQTVQKAITPNSADLATYTEYDGVGRESKQWLPVVSSGGGGFVDYSSFTSGSSLYNNDSRPYTETHYEASPLNRVDWQQGPGAAWQGHPVSMAYATNASSEVKYFTVSGTALINSGYYGSATLYKTTITDEDGKTTTEYKDKLGQVIMRRGVTNENGNHDTYYVYNDLGQLCYVLPPLAADASGSADAVNKYGYVYRYDARGNCTYKKLPGCEPITMTYYPDDLLMTSQDGNQLTKNESLLYEYDGLRRLIRTSLVASSGTVVLIENYYDNYDFIGSQTTLNFVAKSGYDGQHPSAKGLLTGTRTRILDSSNKYNISALYYDYRGLVVKSRSTNHLDGYNIVYNTYDFTGHVTKNLKEHNIAGQTTITELYDYIYDHAGRLIQTKYKLDDKPEVVLNEMAASGSYDELGRLRKKKRHNSTDSEEFDYNIRNWTTRIKSGEFEEQLYYNSQANGASSTLCFNGNIAYSVFGNTNSMPRSSYAYTYDKLNRLKSASAYYFTYSQSSAAGNDETFNYDKMGNITSLSRYKENYIVDNLLYDYNGNQVTSIYDPAGSRNSYSVKEYQNKSQATSNEFLYDASGNLTKDLDRDIYTIKYNILNLPEIIQFKDGHQIINLYDASGKKLNTRYYTILMKSEVPVVSTLQPGQVLNLQYNMDIIDETGTFYIDNIEYGFNGCDPGVYMLDKVYNTEGYADRLGTYDLYYNYYRRDHLGNNREVWLANTNTTIQRTQYYPSGLPWAESSGSSIQPYKYNGKEFVEMHGLDEYDSQARWYYPAILRTTTIDPLAEKYYSVSPYVYCGGNPVNRVDPDGMDWYSYQEEYTDKEEKKQNRTSYKYVEGQMSKKEMKENGYTHLGKTYTNGNDYYSLFGSKKDLKTDEGLLYKKTDEAIINYAEAKIENMNLTQNRNSWDNTEDDTNYGYTDFSINGISGKRNFSYEGSYYGMYINFTGKGMNRANMENWIGDSNMPIEIGAYLPTGERKSSYHIRFQNQRRGDPVHLRYNKREAMVLLRKFYNLFPLLKSR